MEVVPPPPELVAAAAACLRRDEIVCYPTETFYGLAARISPAAVARLVALKGREPGKPIALIVPDLLAARRLWRELPAALEALARRHWPGPLTVVAPARPDLPGDLVGPGGGVGARVSSHPWAQALAAALGEPLTATSANRAGAPPARTAAEAAAVFGAAVACYLDAGPAPGGAPSTVVDVDGEGHIRVLRPGAIVL